MEDNSILQYFEGKSILITGSTGFLAKVFIEKILRTQPNIKKLFLLIRGDNKRSIECRLEEEIINTELFRVLRERHGSNFNSALLSKLVPVSGDVSHENLGINSQLRQEMLQEIDIIINSAATTNFNERYDVAFKINTLGAKHVRDFATKCSKIDMLLQVSTAFVHGTRVGVIPEKPFHMGETLDGSKLPYLDITAEERIIEETLKDLHTDQEATEKDIARVMKDLGSQRAKLHGWPNTYVFTKAMGEMFLERFKEKANVIIIRPTIITSTYKEPFAGWIEGVRTLDAIFVAFGKGKLKFFLGDPDSILDMIPCDMVVNAMLAAMAHGPDHLQQDLLVYHIGSSRCNPLKFAELKWLMHRYLIKNPLLDDRGRAVKIGLPTTFDSMASFQSSIAARYMPILKILKFMNIVCWNHFASLYANARRRIEKALRLADLYKPYLFFKGIFDDTKAENLRMAVRGQGINMDTLNFDPTCIHWDDYFVNTHFPGFVQYALT